jgi:hypothetical protein
MNLVDKSTDNRSKIMHQEMKLDENRILYDL